MLRLFYKVDEDYGNRVAEGLGFKDTSSFFQKIGQAMGLTTDKSHPTTTSNMKEMKA
jgi:hypothetical protein